MRFRIYRFDPGKDARPYFKDYTVELAPSDRKVLDALERVRAQDDSLAYRRSCREGVCGSDAMNINGRNALACITPLEGLREPVTLAPLPSFPVVRDLVVDMTQFFAHYHAIRPYLLNDDPPPERERLQSPQEREAERPLRVHPVRLLQQLLPFVLVESGQVPRSRGAAPGRALHRRQPGPRRRRPAGVPRRRLQALSLPHHHELHRGLPEEPQPGACDRENQDRAAAQDLISAAFPPVRCFGNGATRRVIQCGQPLQARLAKAKCK
jgi:hypothetical protein